MKNDNYQETEVIPIAKEKKAKKPVVKDDTKKPVLQKTCTRCVAAVPFKTKKDALNHLMKENKLYYIVNENKAYYQCKKSSEDDSELCHLHKQTFDEDKSKIKLFDKDIVLNDIKDNNRIVLTPKDSNHPYFDNMEKRGAKKKHRVIDIEEESEDVFECFQDEERKRMLIFCARQILTGAKITSFLTTSIQPVCVIEKTSPKKTSNKDIVNSSDECYDSEQESATYDSENDSDEEQTKSFEKKRNKQLVEQFKEYFQDDEEQDLFEDQMESIYTNDRKLLFLNKMNNNVFEPEDDDDVRPMGKLIEVAECSLKYATIMRNKKYSTVVRAIKDDVYGVLFRCSLSNNLFDHKMRRMGTIKMKKGTKNVFDYKIEKSYLKANKISV